MTTFWHDALLCVAVIGIRLLIVRHQKAKKAKVKKVKVKKAKRPLGRRLAIWWLSAAGLVVLAGCILMQIKSWNQVGLGNSLLLGGIFFGGLPFGLLWGIRVGNTVGDSIQTVARPMPSIAELQATAQSQLGRNLTTEEVTLFYQMAHNQKIEAGMNLAILGGLWAVLHENK